jgi:hypothetical protein
MPHLCREFLCPRVLEAALAVGVAFIIEDEETFLNA